MGSGFDSFSLHRRSRGSKMFIVTAKRWKIARIARVSLKIVFSLLMKPSMPKPRDSDSTALINNGGLIARDLLRWQTILDSLRESRAPPLQLPTICQGHDDFLSLAATNIAARIWNETIFFRVRPRAEGKDFSSEMPSETTQPPSERSISENKNSREALPPQICSQVSVPFRAPTLCLLFFQFSPFFLLLVFRTHLLNFFCWQFVVSPRIFFFCFQCKNY